MKVDYRSVLLLAHCILSGVFGSAFLVMPLIVLMPLIQFLSFDSARLFRAWSDLIQATYLSQYAALIEWLFGTKIYISGDIRSSRDCAILIANHRTRLDWMFLWHLIARRFSMGQMKIALKSELLRFPMYGPTMDLFQFLFLQRDWARDQVEISRTWAHFARLHWPIQLMLFPEGTDFNPKSVEKSRTFTDSRNERPFKYVLAPRATGFAHCVKESRAHRLLRSILDVTIAYETTVPENELAFLAGKMPTAIHFHVERIDVSDINEAKLEQMLMARWRRKDELLGRFATKGRLNNEALLAQRMPVPVAVAPFLWLAILIGGVYAICVSSFLLAWFLTALIVMGSAIAGKLPMRLGEIERKYCETTNVEMMK